MSARPRHLSAPPARMPACAPSAIRLVPSTHAPAATPGKPSRFTPAVSDGALEAASSESVYVTPFSAPFGGFCPRLGSLCKGQVRRRFAVGFRGGLLPVLARRTGRSFAPAPGGKVFTFPGKTSPRRTMPTPSASPGPLVCRTGTPGAPFGDETTGPVRRPAVSPVSPEGDHFPQAPWAKAYVLPPPKAPTPPRRNALRCIRGGIRGVWHGFLGAGKTQ